MSGRRTTIARSDEITIGNAIDQVLADLTGPVSRQSLVERVLAIRPSSAKNPAASIHTVLATEYLGRWLVARPGGYLVKAGEVMRGVRFRATVDRLERKSGRLAVESTFVGYCRPDMRPEDVVLLNDEGRPIPTAATHLTLPQAGLFGPTEEEASALDVSAWFRECRMSAGDSILFTIEDWDANRYRVAREPAFRQDKAATARQDRDLADLIFEALEAERGEWIGISKAILTAYDRLTDPRGYPGNHWQAVIAHDPRMRASYHAIVYADRPTLVEKITGRKPAPATEPITAASAQAVYHVRVSAPGGKRARARLQLPGAITLAEVDALLRDRLRLDPIDHLSGFWRLVRRGGTNRVREVELATINPFVGGDEGADIQWAALGLAPDDELKYVYDFGDWIEFRLRVERVAVLGTG